MDALNWLQVVSVARFSESLSFTTMHFAALASIDSVLVMCVDQAFDSFVPRPHIEQ
jgi:hypothetical protein